jgi:hypothetical protein
MRTLDRAIGSNGAADSRYTARRDASVVIAVNCTRTAATCFCSSMGSGPRAGGGPDLAVTELDADADTLLFVLAGFNASGLRGKMEEDPAFGYRLLNRMPVIALRLAAARRQLLDLYGRPDDRGAAWR